ncbi:hypothetical protein CIL03_13505 [Virgibacillus indicus]|uniref:t-SNARE coiled-coil homology domain-containing protein n=1 Tax=Virgibacillus indicus TaxID=2024554 RepID=A0A265N8G8_9BACI|nr:hypothetical protein [Virgibacillus indicus]OZU88137.1 hypothetical protein CIL03_13505 [Virgibacillus indicus]
MEQTELQAILGALNDFSKKIDEKFEKIDEKFEKIDQRFENLENRMDERFDRLEIKLDAKTVELRETQETVDFLSSKTLQHEKKLRELYSQRT